MTDRDQEIIYSIENYESHQKEINKKLKALKALIKKGQGDSQEAMQLKIDAYYAQDVQETLVSDLTIGTEHYDGVAFFWNYEYRFFLRDADKEECIQVHDLFLKKGLKLDGKSKRHLAIIKAVVC